MMTAFSLRIQLLLVATTAVSAAYPGFFGRPTSEIVDNDKTRALQRQLGEPAPSNIKPKGSRELYYYEHEPVYYEPEPEYYGYKHKTPYYKKGGKMKGGKMKGGKMKGGKMGGGKMGKKGKKGYYAEEATHEPLLQMVFQDDIVFGPLLEDGDCEQFVAAEAFAFGPPTANVTVDGVTGTTYIWSPDYMMDRHSDDLIDAFFSGTCTMTSTTTAYCNFVIVNNMGDQITIAGSLGTPASSLDAAGVLALTGGTGAMAGIIGEAEIFANPIGDNIFEVATQFDVDITLGVIVCRPQPLP